MEKYGQNTLECNNWNVSLHLNNFKKHLCRILNQYHSLSLVTKVLNNVYDILYNNKCTLIGACSYTNRVKTIFIQ